MRKTLLSVFVVILLSFTVLAQDAGPAAAKAKKPAAAVTPKSDAEVQTCINDKLKASTTVNGGSATVSGGVAILTGEAKNGGAKGGSTGMAKRCGAKSVTNSMTVLPKPKVTTAIPPPKKP